MNAEKSKHKLTWQAHTDKAQINVISGLQAKYRQSSVYEWSVHTKFICKSVGWNSKPIFSEKQSL